MALLGIARLASLAPPLALKRDVTYAHLPTRTWINRVSGSRVHFEWSINPYRGCEFGCKYCYARYAHEFMELRQPEDFEKRIFAKQFSPIAFRKELLSIPLDDHVAIGTATDPYQPAERRFRLTRRMLEVMAEERGRHLSVTTKSDLVARDADLLARIARFNVVNVNITVTTMDAPLARLLEPRAPRPDLRIRAVRELAGRGVAVGIGVRPVIPCINDSAASLAEIARAGAAAGARYFGGGVLFLKPCASQVFLPFLEREFPELVERYRKQYAKSAYLEGLYPEAIERRLEAARKEARLERRPVEYQPEPAQLTLF
ncbi:MAG TPA: radical SAM protein [Bryobacteraceae bacterium]|nr:radical SAM protein [Bryobacteraceae bacterium]